MKLFIGLGSLVLFVIWQTSKYPEQAGENILLLALIMGTIIWLLNLDRNKSKN